MIFSPLSAALQKQGYLVLDGGLATELEAYGHTLNDALWSARLLRDNPPAIQQVHLDYLHAGADCLITASYQATIQGFVSLGLSENEAKRLLQSSVSLAKAVRDLFWSDGANRPGRVKPLISASIGPYGAYLANGAEYTGHYPLSQAQLTAFHRPRWHALAQAQPDLFACETIPSFAEARALTDLLPETPQLTAWVSFSCRDHHHISDGTPLTECASYLNDHPQIAAIGINCTPPRFIPSLIHEIKRATNKPILVYPNSGETYDSTNKCWTGQTDPAGFATASQSWYKASAQIIGGCCRTRPKHIHHIKNNLIHQSPITNH